MKRKQPMAALKRTEWDFEPVPDDQVIACCLYEYGREHVNHYNAELRSIFNEWRQANKDHFTYSHEVYRRLMKKLRMFPYVNAIFFPATPWQELKAEWVKWTTSGRDFQEIQDTWEGLPHHRFNISTERELAPSDCKTMEQFQLVHRCLTTNREDSTEFGFFAIDWRYRDSEIRQAFDKWLQDQRKLFKKEGVPDPEPKPRTREPWRTKLHWLGALRVKRHYPRHALADYGDSDLKVDAPYSHLSDIYTKAAHAEKLLQEWF